MARDRRLRRPARRLYEESLQASLPVRVIAPAHREELAAVGECRRSRREPALSSASSPPPAHRSARSLPARAPRWPPAAIKQGMQRRVFRRSVPDATLDVIRPQLTYKIAWRRRTLACDATGELVDRDINAAKNLRDWPDDDSSGSVGATAPKPSSHTGSGGGLGSGAGSPGAGGEDGRPFQPQDAVPGEAGTEPGNRRGTPRRGTA